MDLWGLGAKTPPPTKTKGQKPSAKHGAPWFPIRSPIELSMQYFSTWTPTDQKKVHFTHQRFLK